MTITVAYEWEDSVFRIMVASHGFRPAPGGPRIFRAPPHPDVQWTHDTMEGAERDAAKVRAYLDDVASGRLKARKEEEAQPRRRGWWED